MGSVARQAERMCQDPSWTKKVHFFRVKTRISQDDGKGGLGLRGVAVTTETATTAETAKTVKTATVASLCCIL